MTAPDPAPWHRRNQHWFRIGLLFAVPAVLLATFFSLRRSRDFAESVHAPVMSLATNWQAAIDASTAVESRRTIFPYSVIPGGVRDGRELTAAVAKDPVVADHYAGFRLTRAHTIRLGRATAMYVSYRMNNRVFWTKNPLNIPAGETLISDGENLARARCGNRLSALAAKPVSASEPPIEKLESPEFVPPLLANLLPDGDIRTLPTASLDGTPPLPLLAGFAPVGPSISIGTPYPPILLPGIRPPSPSSTPPSGPPGTPPPVATPEPPSLILLGGGMLLLALCYSLSRK